MGDSQPTGFTIENKRKEKKRQDERRETTKEKKIGRHIMETIFPGQNSLDILNAMQSYSVFMICTPIVDITCIVRTENKCL